MTGKNCNKFNVLNWDVLRATFQQALQTQRVDLAIWFLMTSEPELSPTVMTRHSPEPLLATPAEVVDMCALGSVDALRMRIRRGTFPQPVRIGRRLFWRVSDLNAFVLQLAPTAPISPVRRGRPLKMV